ncbi:MAG: hypothetical protein ACI4TY_05055, partial [Candidatus Limosilactobacillus intestinavium]
AHLPLFNSSLAQKLHPETENEITIPIADNEALVSYYLAYRKEDYSKLRNIIEVIQKENSFNNK